MSGRRAAVFKLETWELLSYVVTVIGLGNNRSAC